MRASERKPYSDVPGWLSRGCISVRCDMPKPVALAPPRIVPITGEKHRVIATDEKSKRLIFAIGNRRVAFDLISSVTELPPNSRDELRPVRSAQRRRKRKE